MNGLDTAASRLLCISGLGCIRGGRVVLIGMAAFGSTAALPLDTVVSGCEIVAVMAGGARPERDYPELIRLAQQGKLEIASQITRVWPLAVNLSAGTWSRRTRATPSNAKPRFIMPMPWWLDQSASPAPAPSSPSAPRSTP